MKNTDIEKKIKEFHKKFTKQVDTESHFVIADPKLVEQWLSKALTDLSQAQRELHDARMREKINSRAAIYSDEDEIILNRERFESLFEEEEKK